MPVDVVLDLVILLLCIRRNPLPVGMLFVPDLPDGLPRTQARRNVYHFRSTGDQFVGNKEGTVVQTNSATFLDQIRARYFKTISDAHTHHSPAGLVRSHGCDFPDLFLRSLPIVAGSNHG